MEVLRDNSTLWSWVVDIMSILLAKYTPDGGDWDLIVDLQQDFFAAISNEIRNTPETGPGEHPPTTPVTPETDAEANYVKIAGVAALLEAEARKAFFTWYNGLSVKKQAAFRRLAGKAENAQLVAYVKMTLEERDQAITGFLALDPTADHETHTAGHEHDFDLHKMLGWLYHEEHELWEHMAPVREHIQQVVEEIRPAIRKMTAETKQARNAKKSWLRRIF